MNKDFYVFNRDKFYMEINEDDVVILFQKILVEFKKLHVILNIEQEITIAGYCYEVYEKRSSK